MCVVVNPQAGVCQIAEDFTPRQQTPAFWFLPIHGCRLHLRLILQESAHDFCERFLEPQSMGGHWYGLNTYVVRPRIFHACAAGSRNRFKIGFT